MRMLWQDARFALRGMARDPGFTAVVIATLGIAIGTCTAVFRVAGAVPRPVLLRLAAAAAITLLIACANCANLLIARGMLRRGELAVRAAMGAGRLRVFRLALAESVLLALLGGVTGLLLAWWGVDILMAVAPPELAGTAAGIDGRAAAFTLAISLICGLLFGLAPALDSIHGDGQALLKQPPNPASQGLPLLRGAGLLAIAEVALALSLLIGAGLMTEGFWRVAREHPGFQLLRQMRFETALLAAFAAIVLSLAMAGVYAVMCQTVGRRSREISIRLALGARQGEVVRMVAGQAMTLVGVGSAIGMATGVFAARALAALPYGVHAADMTALVSVSAILAAAVAPAGYFPARAASKIEPRLALKSD